MQIAVGNSFFTAFSSFVALGTLSMALHSPRLEAQVSLGQAELSFEGRASVLYLSNPYLRDEAFKELLPIEDTFAFVVDPTLHLAMGDGDSRYQINAKAGVALRRLDALPVLDGEDAHLNLTAAHRGTRGSWNLRSSFEQGSLPEHGSRNTEGLAKRETRAFSWNGGYRYSPKTRLTGGLNWSDRSYGNTPGRNYSDFENLSLPVGALYQLTEKLELGGGLRYREREESFGGERDDLAYHVSLLGELTNKVTADLKVGLLNSLSSTVPNAADGTLFVLGNVGWKATQATTLTLNLLRDNQSTSYGDAVLRQSLGMHADWRISTRIAARLSGSYERERYELSQRRDKTTRVSCNFVYDTQKRYSSALHLGYERNDSNALGWDYNNLTASWSSAWRF